MRCFLGTNSERKRSPAPDKTHTAVYTQIPRSRSSRVCTCRSVSTHREPALSCTAPAQPLLQGYTRTAGRDPGQSCSCPNTTQRTFGAAIPAWGGCKPCPELNSHGCCTTFTHTAALTDQHAKGYHHLQSLIYSATAATGTNHISLPLSNPQKEPLPFTDLKRFGFFGWVRFCWVRFPLLNPITNAITHFMAQENCDSFPVLTGDSRCLWPSSKCPQVAVKL